MENNNSIFEGLAEEVLKRMSQVEVTTVNGFKETNTRIDIIDNKVEVLDKKVDTILSKLDSMSAKPTINNIQRTYQSMHYKFACGHSQNMTRNTYNALRRRAKDLDVKFCCMKCTEELAKKKYADFYKEYNRLPNKDEVAGMIASKRAEILRRNEEKALAKAKRQDMTSKLMEARRAQYMKEHYNLGPDGEELK